MEGGSPVEQVLFITTLDKCIIYCLSGLPEALFTYVLS